MDLVDICCADQAKITIKAMPMPMPTPHHRHCHRRHRARKNESDVCALCAWSKTKGKSKQEYEEQQRAAIQCEQKRGSNKRRKNEDLSSPSNGVKRAYTYVMCQ